jgi:hypothetical protein
MTNEQLMQAMNDKLKKLLILKREILVKILDNKATKMDKKNLETIRTELELMDAERIIIFLTDNNLKQDKNIN